MSEVQVFLVGDVVPAGLDVADVEGRYFRWASDHIVRQPMVAGLPSWRSQWQKAVIAASDALADEVWAHNEGLNP